MRVLYPGHLYELDNIKSDTKTMLQFRQDGIHPIKNGPSCQEVTRVLIDRVLTLNDEIAWCGNADIVYHLRCALAGFEARAIIRKTEKGMQIEHLPVELDGHLIVKWGD